MIETKMTRKRLQALVLTVLLLMPMPLISSRLGEKDSQESKYGGVFRVKSFTNSFRRQLDPIKPDSFIFLSEQLYDGLVRLNKNFNIVPSLAQYWEISRDGTKYTFHLRKGVLFHHGGELTAEDVKFSFERILDKENQSPYYQFFLHRVKGAKEFREGETSHVAGFRVKDKYTFEIHWIKPYVSALYLMSMHFCKVLPQEMVQEKGERFFWSPSGSGPFAFDYWLRDPRLNIVGVRLKRNDEYFGGKPYLENVEFCPLYDLDHFLNGEIHSIPLVSSRLLNSGYQIFEDGALHLIYLGMSCDVSPLDRAELRQAVQWAVDKEEIIKRVNEDRYRFRVSHNYIPSKLPGFFPQQNNHTDPKKAQELIRQMGFSQGHRFPNFLFFIHFPKSDYKYKIFKTLKSQLDPLGISLRLRYYNSFQEIKKSEKPYLVYREKLMNFPDPEDIIRTLFFSRSIFNVFGYNDPELDKLLKEAEVERSWTQRIELFHRMERILSSKVPAIPLFTQQNRVVMQPYVRGIEIPALGFYYLDTRKIWFDQ